MGLQPKTVFSGYTCLNLSSFSVDTSPPLLFGVASIMSCVLCFVSTCVVVCEPSGAGLVALVLGSEGFRPFCEPQAIMALYPLFSPFPHSSTRAWSMWLS